MSTPSLVELNQRYVRLTDRCRSQWTFYQFLVGLFKHLRDTACPIELDFPALFNQLRELAASLGHAEAGRSAKTLADLAAIVDAQAAEMLRVDHDVPPSLLRRFFDRLRNQDEKVLLAIIKFYLDSGSRGENTLDKLDILFTRLAEIPREDGSSLVRERHELERLVQPLLQHHSASRTPDNEVEILLHALADLKAEVLACRAFTELVAGGGLDRFRTLKQRLGESMLHPRLLPVLMETTVAVKNRFRELREDEENHLLDDTNKVHDLERQMAGKPEMVTPELREALADFASARQRVDQARQTENVRREDILDLRVSLNRLLDQFDRTQSTQLAVEADPDIVEIDATQAGIGSPTPYLGDGVSELTEVVLADPLLHDFVSKILFALELVGNDRTPAEAVHARELSTLRLEPWEVEACRFGTHGRSKLDTLDAERAKFFLRSAALRIRMDEESQEVERLQRRGSEHLPDLLERATQSLGRAAELDRRFSWFIEDALYRGQTADLDALYRSRFRLMKSYSTLWLIHNECGGISPF